MDTTSLVSFGTPITTHQAALGILREIRSPLVGDVNLDQSVGYTLRRLHKMQDEGTTLYEMLSKGEQRLVDIAQAIWTGADRGDGAGYGHVAAISVLGGLDRDLRRKVWLVLGYYYLGSDVWDHKQEMDPLAWQRAFGERS